MTTIDIIILVILGAGAIVGFAKGFLRQLAGLLGLVAGLLIAKALYATVAERIFLPLTDSLTVAQGIAFVIIWLAVPLAFLLLALLLTKAMEAVSLGWVNRLLGAGLGLLKSALLVSLLICVVEYIDTDNALLKKTKSGSLCYIIRWKSLQVSFYLQLKKWLSNSYDSEILMNLNIDKICDKKNLINMSRNLRRKSTSTVSRPMCTLTSSRRA